MPDTEMEKTSYGAFERFIYIFFIPAVFTMILSIVLLSLFDYDVKNTLLRVGHNIPIVGRLLPQPDDIAPDKEEISEPSTPTQDEIITELKTMLSNKETELLNQVSKTKQLESTIDEQKILLDKMEQEAEQKALSDEEYKQSIRSLASLYAGMSPSKASKVLENLTLSELVLVLNEMKSDERVKVLEKMDPKIAAEASILLKDVTPVKDKQIAALQERLSLYIEEESVDTQKLSYGELAQTFAGMAPKSAAALLQEMMKVNEKKVIAVLNVMETASRSGILSALSDLSKEDAARLTAALSD